MNELTVTINQTDIEVKEYQNQRVVTLREIDDVHKRPEGTARRNFNSNRKYFIAETDFFTIDQPDEIRTLGLERPQGGIPESVTLMTESGYLMLVKSFTDDLAWEVQRQLVNTYFRAQNTETNLKQLSPELRFMISVELKQKEQDKAIAATNVRIDGIRDVVALSPNSWRSRPKIRDHLRKNGPLKRQLQRTGDADASNIIHPKYQGLERFCQDGK